LPPFFFPPLAAFFAIRVVPPFNSGLVRRLLPHGDVAAAWHADSHVGRHCFAASSSCKTNHGSPTSQLNIDEKADIQNGIKKARRCCRARLPLPASADRRTQ
jgi:hypothetical protein